MSVAKNLLLVAIDARTGRVRVVTRTVEAALGGAALIDLVLLGRLRLEGSGRKARVEVSSPPTRPPGRWWASSWPPATSASP